MRITSAVLVLLWVLGWPRPALAEEKLGKVTFPISCGAAVSAQFERGVAMLHSYWFVESRKVFDAIVHEDSSCAMEYWGLAVTALGNSLAAPPAPKDAAAAWAALEKARAVGAKTQRERDWIEAIAAYYRDHTGDGADDAAVPRRLRGVDVLRANAPGLGTEERQDLRQPAQVGGDPRAALHAESRSSRRRALPGARLRLPTAGRQGDQGRGDLRAHRAGRAARPAHALPHLLDGRDVGRVDRLEPVGARDPAGLPPRDGLHGVRAPAARSGRASQGARRCHRRAAPAGLCQRPRRHRHHGDPRTLRARARRLGRRCRAADDPDGATSGRFADSIHARAGHGAERRSRGSEGRGPGDAGPPRRARDVESVLLGRTHRRADARGLRVGGPGRRRDRPGGEAHARGRRRRGWQREARRDGESPLSDARAAR